MELDETSRYVTPARWRTN